METKNIIMRKEHYKLVRDLIPEIIKSEGKKPYVRKLDEKEMIRSLENKLLEEVNEYLEDKTVEELADVIEVIYALCQIKGVSRAQLEKPRTIKEMERGSFNGKIFLEYVDD